MAGEPPNGSEEFSPEDIDAALAGGAAGETSPAQGGEPKPADESSGTSVPEDIDAASVNDAEQVSGEQAAEGAASAPGTGDLRNAGADGLPKSDSQESPLDDVSSLMEAAIAAEKAAAPAAASPPIAAPAAPAGVVPLDLPDLRVSEGNNGQQSIGILNDVFLNVKIELGRSSMYIEEVLRLAEGSVVELDKLAGDPVDILVNDRLVARGEVLVLNDNFCVRISEILTPAAEELSASQE